MNEPAAAVDLYAHSVAHPLPPVDPYEGYEAWWPWPVSVLRDRRSKQTHPRQGKLIGIDTDPMSYEDAREVLDQTVEMAAQGTCPFCETPYSWVRVPGKAGSEIARCMIETCERQFTSDRIVLVSPDFREMILILESRNEDIPYWMVHAEDEWSD